MTYDSWEKEEKTRKQKAIEAFDQIYEAIKTLGIKETIRIEFSGSGDSGGIDYITGLGDTDSISQNLLRRELHKQVKEWAGEFASRLGVDWWNNEGGAGWIEIHPEPVEGKRVTYEVGQNEIVVRDGARGGF